jgi:UDP:flavonoid glycosyltransferase YjiC (YdhE family)
MTSFGSYGDVFPYIGLAIGLRARGHQPCLAVPSLYRELVEREGLAFHAIRPELDPDDRALAARIMDPVRGSDVIFSELLIPSLPQTYADVLAASEGADLIVTHPASLAGPIVAVRRGLPWASSVLAPLSFFSVTDPIVPPPAPWLHALLSRSPLLSRWFARQTERLTRKWAEPVQAFRASLGLPRGGNPVTHGQHSPHLVLALFSRVLADPQPDWPPRTVMTGAVLYNGADADSLPPEVSGFLDAGDPPIVFTLGTSAVFAAGRFYEVSAAAAERLGRRAVLLVGRHGGNRPDRLGAGILPVEFVPHRALFARAAAIVHQGGAGTLHQAMAAGRPMLVVPHSHDQPDNAARVVRAGLARTLYPRRYTVAALERELGSLLGDRAYADRAARAAAVVRGEDAVSSACDAIDRLLHDQGR